MKKILSLLLILITTSQLLMASGWNRAMLRIRDGRGKTISINVDGRKFNKIARAITVGDLPAGRHNIEIYKYNHNGYGYSTARLIYQGMIMVKPGKIYYITVRGEDLDIEENCCIDDYGHWNNNDDFDNWDDDNHCWSNNNHTWNNNQHWNEDNNPRGRNDRDNNYQENNWDDFNGAMSTGRYQQLIDQIRKASFETSKLNVAKAGMKNNRIDVNQMIGILNEFTFESSKLEFAQENYRNLTNKRDFYLINEVFTFQSSKDEIAEFLNRQR